MLQVAFIRENKAEVVERLSKRIDHVEDGIRFTDLLPEITQQVYGVKNATEISERQQDESGHN